MQDTIKQQGNGIELLIFMVATGIFLTKVGWVFVARTTKVVKFVTPRLVRYLVAEAKNVAAMYQGATIITLDAPKLDKINNYHTRYENSARGHNDDDQYQLTVSKGA